MYKFALIVMFMFVISGCSTAVSALAAQQMGDKQAGWVFMNVIGAGKNMYYCDSTNDKVTCTEATIKPAKK